MKDAPRRPEVIRPPSRSLEGKKAVEWLLGIAVVVVVVAWLGRADRASDADEGDSSPPPGPLPIPSRPRPPVRLHRRDDRYEDAFADGAVFGYFAAGHWFVDDPSDDTGADVQTEDGDVESGWDTGTWDAASPCDFDQFD